MQTSEQINELATALSKAQGALTGAKKDSANPFFKSRYADLESVWDACRDALAKNGLSVVQGVSSFPGTDISDIRVIVTTMLAHTSGQWIRDAMALTPKDSGPQAMGSCITYGRRYGLAAIVGVYQTDDDAEAAQGRRDERTGPTPAQRSKATKDINEYSKRVMQALDMNLEGAACDIMREAKEADEDLAIGVWQTFSTPVRKRLREVQAEADRMIQNRNGQPTQ